MLLLVATRQDFKDSDETSAGQDLSEGWKWLYVTLTERKTQNDNNIALHAFQSPWKEPYLILALWQLCAAKSTIPF